MKIGWIGLGNMGMPMALNLHKAGYEVYGNNRSKGKEEQFQQQGGKIGLTIVELAQQMDIIMTCLPMPADVEDVYLGEQGLFTSAKEAGKEVVFVDFSTVSPELSVKLFEAAEEHGCAFLDAPVSGGVTGAVAGTLSIMVGGRQEDYDRVKPLLEVVGGELYYVGASGSGQAVKLINQLMVAVHTQAVSEAFTLGSKAGIDSDVLYDILKHSFAQSRIMDRHYTEFIATGETKPGFAMKLLAKDVNLVADMAEAHGLGLMAGRRAQAILNRAVENDYGELDMSRLIDFQRAEDGIDEGADGGASRGSAGGRGQGGSAQSGSSRVGTSRVGKTLFAALLTMRDEEKNAQYRPAHLDYLEMLRKQGHIFAYGRFVDGAGGLIIYRGTSFEEVEKMVQQDPYVLHGARDYSVHEWAALLADG